MQHTKQEFTSRTTGRIIRSNGTTEDLGVLSETKVSGFRARLLNLLYKLYFRLRRNYDGQ